MNNDLKMRITKFRDDRNWAQFHNPKDLAISLSLEAAELLENFQWVSSEEALQKNREKIKEELADILILSILLGDVIDVDLDEIVDEKLKKNEDKYPVDKAQGRNEKYTEL